MKKILCSNISSAIGIFDKGSSSYEDGLMSGMPSADAQSVDLSYVPKLALYINALVYLFNEFNYLLVNEDANFNNLISLKKKLISLGEEVDKSAPSLVNEDGMVWIQDKLKELDERIHLDNLMKNLGLFGKDNLIMSQVTESITKYIAESQSNISVREILFSFVKLKCFVPIFEYTKETMKLLKSDIKLYELQEAEIEYYIDFCTFAFPEEKNIDNLISYQYVNASRGYEIDQIDITPYHSFNETLVKIEQLLIGKSFESITQKIDYIKQLNLTHF